MARRSHARAAVEEAAAGSLDALFGRCVWDGCWRGGDLLASRRAPAGERPGRSGATGQPGGIDHDGYGVIKHMKSIDKFSEKM